MKHPISSSIIKKITGFSEWAQRWKDYNLARAKGIEGLSGREELEAIESLRPDYKKEEIIH